MRRALPLFLLSLPLCAHAQQLPLAPNRESGQTVTPVFEGWYRNPDGSYSLSFGYYNRNTAEVIEIPIGAANHIAPGALNQGQPTHFAPRRHWGVFAIKVPANFGEKKVTWTLVIRGDTFVIPGSLKQGWEIDALNGEADTGNKPPVLRFLANGPEGSGPGGVSHSGLSAVVGTPIVLDVWVSDDGKPSSSISSAGKANAPVVLTWFKHQGPGTVTFGSVSPAVERAGKATTTATFDTPGEYVLRVRANDDSGVVGGGHAQCCWTNGFVRVKVTAATAAGRQ